ncbi:ribosome silencing factor [Mitsuaria sp. WAJ17]|uniref:ribosome silencing factor n=1 Tax=Mitsuaria sp. WAJ17 TaxID=2761452 RepID=UPI0016026BD5|nr:ribosome silencing factor [Mitsuaria sp. WAJ17]MBB2485524.1 ribosome silencing factor [Mitsuaria sp. WAJ17]
MDIRKLQRAIVDGLEDVKAQDIVVFNTEHLSPLFERVIIASGTSNRQTKALASSVRETVKGRGMAVMRTEGEDNGEWIIVDCGAAVVHVMQPAIREYYHLEEIWGEKPVKLKVASGETKLVKASEDASEAKPARKAAKKPAAKAVSEETEGMKAAVKKPAAKKTATKTVVAKKAATKTTGTKGTATKTTAKTPAKRRSTELSPRTKEAVTVKVGTKKPAAKKAPVKAAAKPAAKRATAKPAAQAAAKPAARKPAAKKSAK